jgi:hypothetical protein
MVSMSMLCGTSRQRDVGGEDSDEILLKPSPVFVDAKSPCFKSALLFLVFVLDSVCTGHTAKSQYPRGAFSSSNQSTGCSSRSDKTFAV